jgi:hypothetical protein
MNPIIKTHFDTFETRLIENPFIVSCQILRREIAGLLQISKEILFYDNDG